ncbi:D-alanyl-D-alanine carboxypeptidase/D-alanyl-D-alanine endopeptidase [Arenibacterium sp. CAU 1754]
MTRRRLIAGLGAVLAANPVAANAPSRSLRPQMRGAAARARPAGRPETMVSKAGLSGQVAWAVADVKSGLRLESVKGDLALPPASVTKTLTALYALEVLGGDHRFVTRLMATAPVQNGVLDGDLLLVGGGDPLLNTDHLAEMARQLKVSGLREVRGRFLVHDGALPRLRSIDDAQPDQVGYNPAVSGIALNFNRVHFEWKKGGNGYAISMDARTERYRPEVQMARMRVVDRQTPVFTYDDSKAVEHWTVARGALGRGGSRWLPVRKPADYAGDVMRSLVRSHGIVLKQAESTRSLPPGGDTLVTHQSAPLWSILKGMLKYSTNLTAEMIGLSATTRLAGHPASIRASARHMSKWAEHRFGMKNTLLVDHSGLGDGSRMTAEDLVGALVEVRKRGALRPLLKTIAIRDAKGRLLRDHPIKVNAKTGTLNFVSGLGGFMTAADGTELAFAIFAADTATRSRIKKADRETPQGARSYNSRAKKFQQVLIERWGLLYGS